MPVSYNLVDEGFIPCLMVDGSARELGLQETLGRAHNIREVRATSPLVTIALQRLLLAVLHRVFGPADFNDWKALLRAGCFDEAGLRAYFREWHSRFDILDEARPFYQTGGLETREPLPAAALYDELASGNNPTLFDHSVDEVPTALPLADAARGLVFRQAFAVGFGKSPTCWIHGRQPRVGYRKDAPLVRGMTVLLHGPTLFDTLVCNLTSDGQPGDEDIPAWERDDPEGAMDQSRPLGWADLYTWQSRRLRLVLADTDDAGAPVTHVHFAQGRAIDKDVIDPMKPYRKDETRGWLPLNLTEGRALWRDSAALLQLSRDEERPIAALNWTARAVADSVIPLQRMYTLDLFGAATEPGKAGNLWLWRHESVPVPLDYLKNLDLVGALRQALECAEKIGYGVRRSVWRTAAVALSSETGRADRSRVDALVESLGAERRYWSHLEVPFRALLVDLPGDVDHQDKVVARWVLGVLRPRAWQAFDESAGRLDHTARFLKAVSAGRQALARSLAEVSRSYEEVSNEPNQ